MSSVVTSATKIGKKGGYFKSIISGFSNIALQIMLIIIIELVQLELQQGLYLLEV